MNRRSGRDAEEETTRATVRERYGRIAIARGGGASPAGSACCGGPAGACCGEAAPLGPALGYSASDLAALPAGADLGLGCGNPTALLALRPGETVLDLGSGAGIDCFLAARQVGPKGRVIGVDMTPEMVAKARENARHGGYRNVEFRLGEIEHVPVPDRSVDVVVSNCVINLVPDKASVYREAFRVLRPGGRFAVSDVVASRPISARDRADPTRWSSCSAGAIPVRRVKRLLQDAGFRAVHVAPKGLGSSPGSLAGPSSLGIVPADIRAVRPAR